MESSTNFYELWCQWWVILILLHLGQVVKFCFLVLLSLLYKRLKSTKNRISLLHLLSQAFALWDGLGNVALALAFSGLALLTSLGCCRFTDFAEMFSDAFAVQSYLQRSLYFKILAECASGRILKIGENLAKIQTRRVCWRSFVSWCISLICCLWSVAATALQAHRASPATCPWFLLLSLT